MLSKGIMILALLSLVYLLLVTMNNNSVEDFQSKTVPTIENFNAGGKQSDKQQSHQNVKEKLKQRHLQARKDMAKKAAKDAADRKAADTKSTEPFTNSPPPKNPVINYNEELVETPEHFQEIIPEHFQEIIPEPFKEVDAVDNNDIDTLLISAEDAHDENMTFRRNYYQPSYGNTNFKNPSYDLRSEAHIPFQYDKFDGVFNSSSWVGTTDNQYGTPLRERRLLAGDVDGNCDPKPFTVKAHRFHRGLP
jgi:hypothetical protein